MQCIIYEMIHKRKNHNLLTFQNTEIHLNNTNLVPTSEKTHCISITSLYLSVLLRYIIALCSTRYYNPACCLLAKCEFYIFKRRLGVSYCLHMVKHLSLIHTHQGWNTHRY
jgi:hypothetical protein